MVRKPYELDILPLDGKKFTRSGDKLVAFASDFGPLCDRLWWLQRLYNDACDVGISIMGNARAVRFSLVEECVEDGELQSWKFRPLDDGCGITGVVIFND